MATPPGWEPAEPATPKTPPGWEPTLPTAINNPVTRSVATTGQNLFRMLVPQSVPSGIGQAAALIPIPGPLGAVARPALAATAAGVVDKIRGKDAGSAALEAGSITGLGEVVGGIGRAGARYALSKLDPMARNVASVIGNLVPVFKGANPRSTITRAMGTEGQVALSKQYGDAVDTAITQAGNPFISPIAPPPPPAPGPFARPFPGTRAAPPVQATAVVPGYSGPADKVWAQIKSEKNRLLTLSRDPARVKDVYPRLDEVHAAEEAFAKAIEAKLPPDKVGVFAKANLDYRQGKEIQRLFAPTGRMTATKAQKILKPGEGLDLDQPTLATNLMLRAGKLQEAFGPEGYKALEQAIQRGGVLGGRDIPGSMPHMRMHIGVIPSIYGMPHAPRLVGRPETQSSIIAAIARALGARAAGTQIEQP